MPSYDSFMCPNLRRSFPRDLARTSSESLPSLRQDRNKVSRLSRSNRTLRFSLSIESCVPRTRAFQPLKCCLFLRVTRTPTLTPVATTGKWSGHAGRRDTEPRIGR